MSETDFLSIDRYKKKVRSLTSNTMIITKDDAKSLDADIDRLLIYTVNLQKQLIEALQGGNVIEIEMGGGDFYEKPE